MTFTLLLVLFERLYYTCDGPRRRGFGLFGGIDGEGDGLEAVVVGALCVVNRECITIRAQARTIFRIIYRGSSR